jgi:hypothetical protein
MIGAKLEVQSATDYGTVVILELPWLSNISVTNHKPQLTGETDALPQKPGWQPAPG